MVLDRGARPADDPVLLLRAATAAAERDAVLAPPTAARLVREAAPLPDPWPTEARQLLVRMLASGRGLLGVWETLEETGALARILPEWERIRLLPHASVIHRFTVDRHVVETCIEASELIRSVSRPDVLMVAALLHDIGKGGLTEHSVAGEPIARDIATRMGFDAPTADLVALLVRHHLLLAETATTRDPDDPATVDLVVGRVGSAPGALAADRADRGRREGDLAQGLVVVAGGPDPRAVAPGPGRARPRRRAARMRSPRRSRCPTDLAEDAASITVEPSPDGCRVTAIAVDRIGLLADLAAMFALQRVPVRAARAWSQGRYAVSVWEVADEHLDPAILRTRFDGIVDGRIDPGARLRPPTPRCSPRPSSYVPRPASRRRCWRCAPPTARASSTSCAPLWRRSTSRSAPRTSTRSDRRRWTCSTSRSRRPARCRRPGPREAAHAVRAALTGENSRPRG